jgi:hypothetical protein
MRRNEKDMPDHTPPGGEMIARNPGVTAIWMTQSYKPFRPHQGAPGVLFMIGDPEEVIFYREGRIATRAEILESIDTGLPQLRAMALRQSAEAVKELDQQHKTALRLLPAA